jgi:hypothetical protein
MIHTARQSAKFIRLVRKLRAEFGSIPIDTETIAVGILEAVVAFHNGQHTTAKEITKSIRCKFGRPNHIFAANVYLIGSPWESDLVSITPAHYYTEFEIKVSRADYNADFRKRAFSTSKHDILQNKVEPRCASLGIHQQIPKTQAILFRRPGGRLRGQGRAKTLRANNLQT